jgi:hypothetical protein
MDQEEVNLTLFDREELSLDELNEKELLDIYAAPHNEEFKDLISIPYNEALTDALEKMFNASSNKQRFVNKLIEWTNYILYSVPEEMIEIIRTFLINKNYINDDGTPKMRGGGGKRRRRTRRS